MAALMVLAESCHPAPRPLRDSLLVRRDGEVRSRASPDEADSNSAGLGRLRLYRQSDLSYHAEAQTACVQTRYGARWRPLRIRRETSRIQPHHAGVD